MRGGTADAGAGDTEVAQMTGNQAHAVELARGIIDGTVAARELSDMDWHLLLLAAGLNSHCSLPLLVAHRALRNAEAQAGYFSELSERRRRPEPVTWD
jgi:hypothetical protein